MVSLDSHDKEVHKAHLFDVLLVPVDPVGRSLDSLVCLRNGKGELSCICGSQHQDVLSLSLPHTLVLEEGLEIQRGHEFVSQWAYLDSLEIVQTGERVETKLDNLIISLIQGM